MPTQLPFPFESAPALDRADFIVTEANAQAVAFIDAYPDWPAPQVALYGPSGSGKSHLGSAWAKAAQAQVLAARDLADLPPGRPVLVEDVDDGFDDAALFALLNGPGPVLLTAKDPPSAWPARLPDLKSRFGALLAFPLWAPDDALLAALARKLFTDRQLTVPDSVIMRIMRSVERSPAAIRDFVAEADSRALAEKRPVSVALVAEILGEREVS
jgi:chromosomal replication initiation ATPase DnaA